VCKYFTVTYEDVNCLSGCEATDCSGPQECTCPDEPAPAKEDEKKFEFELPPLPPLPFGKKKL